MDGSEYINRWVKMDEYCWMNKWKLQIDGWMNMNGWMDENYRQMDR